MGKQTVRVQRMNWDTEYLTDIISGNGFTITEPATFQADETKQKSLYGSRSILYGTNYEDETAFMERYRCECGKFTGKLFEGEICPSCHKPIEFKDVDIGFTGWISLGNNFILNPFYYNKLASIMSEASLSDIVIIKKQVDVDGNIKTLSAEELDEKPRHPFVGIGLIEFRKRFEEIMHWFKTKKKKKADEIDKVLSESSAVFCSHIPIYSTLLRPQSNTADTFYFNSIDKHVNPLFNLSEKIKSAEEIDKMFILSRIQKRVNALWDTNFQLLNGKEGPIRGQILGGSLNYTSRNVIIPNPELRDSELDLSYNTFLELYKFKIIYYLMAMDDISLAKAYDIWQQGYKFDERIYQIMQFIIQKENPKILINRNPTLNYYSMLLMSIRLVKKDISDFTLSVPLSILPGLNADFDGDILNIIGLMNDEIIHIFRKFDPVTRMIMSRDTGYLNDYFAIEKGQMIDLYNYCTI